MKLCSTKVLWFKVASPYLQNLDKKCTHHYQYQMIWKLCNDSSYLKILYLWFIKQVFKFLSVLPFSLHLKLLSWHNLEVAMVLKLISLKNICQKLMEQSLTCLCAHMCYKQMMKGMLQCLSSLIFRAQALSHKMKRSNFSNHLEQQCLTYL